MIDPVQCWKFKLNLGKEMKTSENMATLAPALLAAQKAITFAAKDATNPHFKSKYADLESVIGAVKGALNAQGIMFIQTFSPSSPGFLNLSTRLMHSSGEWIEDEMSIPLQKNDAQGYGSAATYARRYALAAICGLYQADDDGNEAVKPADKPKQEAKKSEPVSESKIADLMAALDAAENIDELKELFASAWTESGKHQAIKKHYDNLKGKFA